MGIVINTRVLVVEGIKLALSLARSSGPVISRRALEEMEKQHPRDTEIGSAPRGGGAAPLQEHTLEKAGSTPALATKSAPSPYAGTSQHDYSGTSQLSAAGKACLPCGNDHLSLAAGSLSEAIRFARQGGITHPEVITRITLATDDLNAFERIDGSPEKVTKLPANEKSLMDDMMAASRNIRHHITDIRNPGDLEQVAALARRYRIDFMKKQIQLQKGG